MPFKIVISFFFLSLALWAVDNNFLFGSGKSGFKQEIASHRALWLEVIENAPLYPQGKYQGKGIVVCAGGSTYLLNAWIHLNCLRENGCELPVELWYYGKEEICEAFILAFQKIKVVCCDLKERFPNLRRGYMLKPFAIVASSFEEILFLDADNHPLRDPSFLFDLPEYKETGALFWPDRMLISRDNPIWEVMQLTPPQNLFSTQESGQLLIHKRKSWLPLQLTLHMNREFSFYYKFLFGDKDTFLFSWLALNHPFYMICYYPGLLHDPKPRHYVAYLQRDTEGKPLFYHLCTRKKLSIEKEYSLQDVFDLPVNDYEFYTTPYLAHEVDRCEHPNGGIVQRIFNPPLYSFLTDYPDAIAKGNRFWKQAMQIPAIYQWLRRN